MIFVLAVSDSAFRIAQVRVYTTEVFTAFAALYDFRRAIVLTLPLLSCAWRLALAAALLGSLVTPRRRLPLRGSFR